MCTSIVNDACDLIKYTKKRIAELLHDIYIFLLNDDSKCQTFSRDTNNVFIITTPEYGNIGDHAIALAMIDYTKKCFPNHNLCLVSDTTFDNSLKWISNNNKDTDLIFLIGGGNFGDLYLVAELRRRRIIKYCHNAKIVMFPQSNTWTDSLYGRLQLKHSINIYGKSNNLHLIARDRNTYRFMKDNFSNNISLLPDIVLTTSYEEKTERRKQILLCFRTDDEKSIDRLVEDKIYNYLTHVDYSIIKTDTETYSTIERNNSKQTVRNTIKLFAESEFVITDRLHGAIFAYITGTPCLVFDNRTKKISEFCHNWLAREHTICFDEATSVEKQIDMLLQMSTFIYRKDSFVRMFDEAMIELTNMFGEN